MGHKAFLARRFRRWFPGTWPWRATQDLFSFFAGGEERGDTRAEAVTINGIKAMRNKSRNKPCAM